jgi:hypothetical protein
MSTVKLKRSGITGSSPSSDDLVQGELAINYADNKLFALSHDGVTVIDLLEIGERVGVATFNGLSGDVIGVSSVNGATGAVTGVVLTSGTQSIAGAKTFTGVSEFTGPFTITSAADIIFESNASFTVECPASFENTASFDKPLSADAGATFTGLVNFKGEGISADTGATFGGSIYLPTQYSAIGPKGGQIQFNEPGNQIILHETTIDILQTLRHYGDTDTYLKYTTDDVTLQAGGNEFLHGTSTYAEFGGVTFAGGGATFSDNLGLTGSSFIMFPDGTTQSQGALTRYTHDSATGANIVDVGPNPVNVPSIFDISSEVLDVNLSSGVATAGGEYLLRYVLSAGSNMAVLDGSSQTWTGSNGNVFTTPIGSKFYAAGTALEVLKSVADSSATHMGVTAGEITFKVSGTDILSLDTDIHAHVGISADAGITLGSDMQFGGHHSIRNVYGSSIFSTENPGPGFEPNIKLGDVDSDGNDTLIYIRDSHNAILMDAAAQIQLDSPFVYIPDKLAHLQDADTYINFQTDQITMAAGGTDYIDITSAGTNFADTEVVRPKLKDYSETALATSSKSASFNVDFESGNVQSFTFADDLTVSFTNPPASGTAGTVTLIIANGGANTTTWNSAVKWPGDNAPALTSSGTDIVSFMTIDAGTTIYGFVGGINFS